MIPILADAGSSNIGLVVQALSALATLVLTGLLLFRGFSGRDIERQVEPTALHEIRSELKAQTTAIQAELKSQTTTLNKLDREMGGLSSTVDAVDAKIDAQAAQVDNAFKRINAISIESAAVKARVEGIENRENRRNA